MQLARLQENFRVAMATLRARKLRSLLTLLGIVVGVASVVTVAGIIEGLRKTVEKRVEAIGARTYFVTRLPLGAFNADRLPPKYRRRPYFDLGLSKQVQEMCPSLDAVALSANRHVYVGDSNEIRYGKELVDNVMMRGVEPGYTAAIPMFTVAEGRFFNEGDLERNQSVVVIGAGIAQSLFGALDPIGREVRLNGRETRVIGVLAPDVAISGVSADQFALMPLTTFHKAHPEIKELALNVSVRPGVDRLQGMQELTDAMRRIRKLRPRAANDFEVNSADVVTALWNQLTGALVILTTVISSVSLLVGGIGVMNVMLISVTERTAEIGVRKAIGARRMDIRLQFLLEAMVLTVAGGALGVALAAVLAVVVRTLYPSIPATLSYQWVAIGVAMSAAVGLFFGFLPANRAAKLDPIACLRYE
jgi:putative ABC transport system permease protein